MVRDYLNRGWPNKMLVRLMAISGLCKVVTWIFYGPVELPDTDWYRQAGISISHLQWSWYNGARAPLYPLLFVLTGFNDTFLFVLQLCMGFATALMLFSIFRTLTSNDTLGFIAGLWYTFSPNQFLFEACLLSETTATFLIVLTFFILTKLIRHPQRGDLLVSAAVVSCLAALTRPLFVYFPIVILIALVVIAKRAHDTEPRMGIARCIAVFVSTSLLLIGADVVLNVTYNDYAGISTLTGFNLINHVGSFVESASPEYALEKEMLISQREDQIRMTGKPTFAVYFVYHRMMQATGKNFEQMSRLMQEMALSAIQRNPLAYAESTVEGMIDFWKPAFQYHSFKWNPAVKVFLYFAAGILTIVYAIFVVSPFLLWLRTALGRQLNWGNEIVIMYFFIAAGWIVSSMVDLGENARYKTPFEPLILAIGTIQAFRMYEYFRARRTT